MRHESGVGIARVIEGGFCVGCGVCAAADAGSFRIELTPEMQFGATAPDPGYKGPADSICPFSDAGPNETQTSRRLFGGAGLKEDEVIGMYRGAYAGFVNDGHERLQSSSGGLATWLLTRLLEKGRVDAVVHVRPSGARLFEYSVSPTVADVRKGRGSHYYPVEMSRVLHHVRERGLSCAVVGIPCFIKAVRNLQEADPEFGRLIRYTIGLVCGHLKSAYFAQAFSWEAGIPPGKLAGISFRHKVEGAPSSDYAVKVKGFAGGKGDERIVRKDRTLVGNWTHGLFRPKACDFCDDIFSETADVVLGDAWLQEYTKDYRGTNIVVTRREEMESLLADGRRSGQLTLRGISPGRVKESQKGNVRNRRAALPLRVRWERKRGRVPGKRLFEQTPQLGLLERIRFYARYRFRGSSSRAFRAALEKEDFELYRRSMSAMIRIHDSTYALERVIRRVRGSISGRGFAALPVRNNPVDSHYRRSSRILERADGLYSHLLALAHRLRSRTGAGGRVLLVAPTHHTGGLGDQAMLEGAAECLGGKCDVMYIGRVDLFDQLQLPRLRAYQVGSGSRFLSAAAGIALRYGSVMVVGADVMSGQYDEEYVAKALALLRMAEVAGLRTRVVGFSYLPNRNARLISAFRSLRVTRFCLRDGNSLQAFRETTGAGRAGLTADLAFRLSRETGFVEREFEQWVAVQRKESRKVVAVNLNGAWLDDFSVDQVRRVVEPLVGSLVESGRSVVFLPHDYRESGSARNSDDKLQRECAGRFGARPGGNRIYTFRSLLSASDVRMALRHADAALSGRFHFTVACLCESVPAIFVGRGGRKDYDLKVRGVLEDLGLPHDAVCLDDLLTGAEELIGHVDRMLEEKEERSRLISGRLPALRAKADLNFSDALEGARP